MQRRYKITDREVSQAIAEAVEHYETKLKDKGQEIFVSRHEIYGILVEEVDECFRDVQANSHSERLKAELLDVIVAALHGVASINSGEMDW